MSCTCAKFRGQSRVAITHPESIRTMHRLTLLDSLDVFILFLSFLPSSSITIVVLSSSKRKFQALCLLGPSSFFTVHTFMSSHTSSNHLTAGFLVQRLPIGFHSNILLAIFEEFILCKWPNHLILWAIINLTMFAPVTKKSSSKLFSTLHVFSSVCSKKCKGVPRQAEVAQGVPVG
jgi:hypothetical protein